MGHVDAIVRDAGIDPTPDRLTRAVEATIDLGRHAVATASK